MLLQIFDLEIQRPENLYEQVVEVDERVRVLRHAPKVEGKAESESEETYQLSSKESKSAKSGAEDGKSKQHGPHTVLREVQGVTGETVLVLRGVDADAVRKCVIILRDRHFHACVGCSCVLPLRLSCYPPFPLSARLN